MKQNETTYFVETQRLLLRRVVQEDIELFYNLDNDPDVMRYINGGAPTPYDVFIRNIFPTFLQYDERFPGFGFLAAVEKTSGEILGWFSFRCAEDNPKNIVLGYRLCKAAWGKGYATEGARALIDKGFCEWGVQFVSATTYQDNLGSIRVMEKVGMKLVRRFRMTEDSLMQSDTHHVGSVELWDGDDVEYAIERQTWAQHQLVNTNNE